MPKQEIGGVDAFFAALNALTYREMFDVAGLVGLQLGEAGVVAEDSKVAEALANAAESHAEAGEDD